MTLIYCAQVDRNGITTLVEFGDGTPSTIDQVAEHYAQHHPDVIYFEIPRWGSAEVLYEDADGTDLLVGEHNVNFTRNGPYARAVTHEARDGSLIRAEIHPTGRHWYVEVKR